MMLNALPSRIVSGWNFVWMFDFHAHRLAVFDQPNDAVVVLYRERRRRHLLRRLGITAAAVAREDRAAVNTRRCIHDRSLPPGVSVTVAAAIEHHRGAFVDEELRQRSAGTPPRRAATFGSAPGRGVVRGSGNLIASVHSASPIRSMTRSSSMRTARGACMMTILPRELSLVLRKFGFVGRLDVHDIGGDRAVGRRRIPARLPDKRRRLRCQQVHREALDRPSLPEGEPFDVDVLQSPLGELFIAHSAAAVYPACRSRGARNPPTATKRVHGLRPGSLRPDPLDGGSVSPRRRCGPGRCLGRQRGGNEKEGGERDDVFHGCVGVTPMSIFA